MPIRRRRSFAAASRNRSGIEIVMSPLPMLAEAGVWPRSSPSGDRATMRRCGRLSMICRNAQVVGAYVRSSISKRSYASVSSSSATSDPFALSGPLTYLIGRAFLRTHVATIVL
jgi:hypothetical protein